MRWRAEQTESNKGHILVCHLTKCTLKKIIMGICCNFLSLKTAKMNWQIEISALNSCLKVWKKLFLYVLWTGVKVKGTNQWFASCITLEEKSICISNVFGLSASRREKKNHYSQSAPRHLHRRAYMLKNPISDLNSESVSLCFSQPKLPCLDERLAKHSVKCTF